MPMIIRMRLYEIRTNKGVSVRRLSVLTGITRAAIYKVENNETDPKLSTLIALSRALKVSILDLFVVE